MNNQLIYRISSFLPVVLLLLTGFSNQIATKPDFGNQFNSTVSVNSLNHNITGLCNAEFKSIFESKDCTVRVKTDDMDIELTLHDVSWWDCTRLKLKALWEFGL